jgi:hypothetical protein
MLSVTIHQLIIFSVSAISIGLNKISSLTCLMVQNTTVDLKCNERSPSQYFVPKLHSIFVHRSDKDNNCGQIVTVQNVE